MDIRKYIDAVERTYHYRIKTVVPLGDEEMGRVERALIKYMPVDVPAKPKKTILQKTPLDFPSLENVEVYILDVELGLPASSYVLQNELFQALKIPEKFIVVRGENDPIENETERLNAERDMKDEAEKSGLKPGALLLDPTNSEAEEIDGSKLYGNEYNSRFLSYLNKVESTRADKQKIDAPNPLFTWLDMPKESGEPAQDTSDFNAGIADKAAEAGEIETAPYGNLDGEKKEHRRLYSKDGKAKVLSRKSDSVRKGR